MTAKELGQQPAFPFVKVSESATHCNDASKEGITMREHIAIEMMKALVTNGDVPSRKQDVATCACDYADALLEQLAKEQT